MSVAIRPFNESVQLRTDDGQLISVKLKRERGWLCIEGIYLEKKFSVQCIDLEETPFRIESYLFVIKMTCSLDTIFTETEFDSLNTNSPKSPKGKKRRLEKKSSGELSKKIKSLHERISSGELSKKRAFEEVTTFLLQRPTIPIEKRRPFSEKDLNEKLFRQFFEKEITRVKSQNIFSEAVEEVERTTKFSGEKKRWVELSVFEEGSFLNKIKKEILFRNRHIETNNAKIQKKLKQQEILFQEQIQEEPFFKPTLLSEKSLSIELCKGSVRRKKFVWTAISPMEESLIFPIVEKCEEIVIQKEHCQETIYLTGIFQGLGVKEGKSIATQASESLAFYLKKRLEEDKVGDYSLTDIAIWNALKQSFVDVGSYLEKSGCFACVVLKVGDDFWVANAGNGLVFTVYPDLDSKIKVLSEPSFAHLERYQRGVENRGGYLFKKKVLGELAFARGLGFSELKGSLNPRPKMIKIEKVPKGALIVQGSLELYKKTTVWKMAQEAYLQREESSEVIAERLMRVACEVGAHPGKGLSLFVWKVNG